MKQKILSILAAFLLFSLVLTGCGSVAIVPEGTETQLPVYTEPGETEVSLQTIPDYSGDPYIALNDNVPEFTEKDYTTESFEYYSELDDLGRCGVTYACVGIDIMPTEDRGNISHVKPTGWHSVQYDCVDGKSLYNRCHLIGFQLTGENANKENLITGTRYLNVIGMLPFENMVADYVKETENHVMYRVTPIFDGDNLVADGVQMEAWSVEDDGEGVCYNVYCYNVQPGVEIDYETGERCLAESDGTGETNHVVLNTNTKSYHKEDCGSVTDMKQSNRQDYTGTRTELEAQGYKACGRCKP